MLFVALQINADTGEINEMKKAFASAQLAEGRLLYAVDLLTSLRNDCNLTNSYVHLL